MDKRLYGKLEDIHDVNRVYTTGQVAEICSVSPNLVCKWFDKGYIKGHRGPVSRIRKIPHKNLVAFMRENEIPLDFLRDYLITKYFESK